MGWVSRFAVTDMVQTWDKHVCTITLKTNIDCHVTLQYTAMPIRLHLQELVRRGWKKLGEPYFCFTQWKTIDQEEVGDTSEHTFLWGGWKYCMILSFAFTGTVGGVTSPSQWGIFKKHCYISDWWPIVIEPWTVIMAPPGWQSVIIEPWQVTYEEPIWTRLIDEFWLVEVQEPDWQSLITEPWTYIIQEPDWNRLILEPWSG